jgi:hypothetical protein
MPTLLGIPYHQKKRYCLNHVFDWLEKAELPDTEVVLREHRGIFGEKDAVKNQREFFRILAVNKNYSHLMYVGADTIPPLDVLPRLLAHNVDVVGAVYNSRFAADNAIAWREGQPEWNRKDKMPKDGIHEVSGMGMDAVLFSRKAFESTSFLDWEQNDDDYPYYDRLKEKGFKIYLDTALICKHYIDERTSV